MIKYYKINITWIQIKSNVQRPQPSWPHKSAHLCNLQIQVIILILDIFSLMWKLKNLKGRLQKITNEKPLKIKIINLRCNHSNFYSSLSPQKIQTFVWKLVIR